MLAWVLVLLYLILAAVFPDLAVGWYMLLVLLLIVAAYFVSDEPHMVHDGRPWRMLHAASLVLGMTGVLQARMSMMYLRQHYRIRHRCPTLTD